MNEIIDYDTVLEESRKNDSSEQIESEDIGRPQTTSQETDNASMETDAFLKQELLSACSKIEKDTKMDLNECVGDVSWFFSHFRTLAHFCVQK